MTLTITYDGYGVVANADSLTNDTGGSGTGQMVWNADIELSTEDINSFWTEVESIYNT